MDNKSNYWTFFTNLVYWYIDDFLNSEQVNDEVYYSIRQSDRESIKAGDKGLLRVGIDKRTKKILYGKMKLKPGIYAIVEIISNPEYIKDEDLEFYNDSNDANNEKWRVKIKVVKNLISSPIIFKETESELLNKDKYLVKGFQASTMPLLKDTFYEVINLINSEKNVFGYEDIMLDETYEFGGCKSGLDTLNKIYENVDIKKKKKLIEVVERGSIANTFKKYVGHKCQICDALGNDPYTFKKKNGEHYSEVHHIIPVNNIEETKLSVDNLICLCPNHHRQLHYGDVEVIDNNDLYIEYKIDGKAVKIQKVNFSIE
ncbi:EVE domain-containing protein [Romboutsia weinsteinii]|uniref:EVE domain-containing protein n=1 Tax=Romboutsia weinsteinii TaxID=2020949 RepID=A0A371IZD6_9FIRM|nr:EVE domain-containing protein [Romboutsia weinsteinii]RDY25836.1 EVE domain-containing protein [Romboutsia weinsteinii]